MVNAREISHSTQGEEARLVAFAANAETFRCISHFALRVSQSAVPNEAKRLDQKAYPLYRPHNSDLRFAGMAGALAA